MQIFRQLLALATVIVALLMASVIAHAQDSNFEDQVQSMYVAYYGRPGDSGGIEFWAQQLETSGGDLHAIIEAFGNSVEYDERYGGLANETLVNTIYQQLLGRVADSEGLAFYVEKLNSGELLLASIALDIFNGVQSEDRDIVANKLEVANRYTDYVRDSGASYGSDDITRAQALLDGVTAAEDSLQSALSAVIDLVDGVIAAFALSSSAMVAGGSLPAAYTCDGIGVSPPLTWSDGPDGTDSYALAMHHIPGPGDTHWYWLLFDIPASVTSLAAAESSVGTFGINSVNSENEYTPPCSQGDGAKSYTITVYALSESPGLADPSTVDRDTLLNAIGSITLDEASLEVSYERTSSGDLSACEEKTAAYQAYSELLSVSCGTEYFSINTDTSLPSPSNIEADKKMVGITAWIQRVPLPRQQTWNIALEPEWLSGSYQSPTSLGPIAIAVNGVPMLHLDKRPDDVSNPEYYDAAFDTVLLGELDQCGAHSGNGEDYHYHYPPVCMLSRHDLSKPIAYDLDGVAIYYGTGGTDYYGSGRYNDVDNFPVGVDADDLDECNALLLEDGSYVHYTTSDAPYFIGCHRASVDSSLNNQNPGNARSLDRDPWLLDSSVEGMTITHFYTDEDNWRHLVLTADEDSSASGSSEVLYRETVDQSDGDCWDFEYRTTEGVSSSDTEVFCHS